MLNWSGKHITIWHTSCFNSQLGAMALLIRLAIKQFTTGTNPPALLAMNSTFLVILATAALFVPSRQPVSYLP